MVSFKEFLIELKETAKNEIKELAKSKLESFEKKEKLDLVVKTLIETTLLKANINMFFKFILKRLILPYVSDLTQLIYDLLKAKINGVTLDFEEV